jgi:hypothetical protein
MPGACREPEPAAQQPSAKVVEGYKAQAHEDRVRTLHFGATYPSTMLCMVPLPPAPPAGILIPVEKSLAPP